MSWLITWAGGGEITGRQTRPTVTIEEPLVLKAEQGRHLDFRVIYQKQRVWFVLGAGQRGQHLGESRAGTGRAEAQRGRPLWCRSVGCWAGGAKGSTRQEQGTDAETTCLGTARSFLTDCVLSPAFYNCPHSNNCPLSPQPAHPQLPVSPFLPSSIPCPL